MRRFEPGDRVRIDIPDRDDLDYDRLHDEVGTVIHVIVDDAEKATELRLEYTITNDRTREETADDYWVPLEYADCDFGGDRPWFRCPGIVDGVHCNRPARKLDLPRGGEFCLCRECYDLANVGRRPETSRVTVSSCIRKRR